MSLFGLFSKKSSAKTAKDRLMMVLEYERASTKINNIEQMKQDIIEVIKKYVKVKDINIKNHSNQDFNALELEIILDK
ncbi:MAG: cell division topological specificity factor MinE [Epsilonproteobacteria bacterium]|nr:cell division topological specificity factor MinE [Campylobacterota bacterium]